jgi:hypothetical protein
MQKDPDPRFPSSPSLKSGRVSESSHSDSIVMKLPSSSKFSISSSLSQTEVSPSSFKRVVGRGVRESLSEPIIIRITSFSFFQFLFLCISFSLLRLLLSRTVRLGILKYKKIKKVEERFLDKVYNWSFFRLCSTSFSHFAYICKQDIEDF